MIRGQHCYDGVAKAYATQHRSKAHGSSRVTPYRLSDNIFDRNFGKLLLYD